MNVYSHFRDKESLFEAMIQSTSDMLIAAFPARSDWVGDFEEQLVQFGCIFLEVLLHSDVLNSVHRHFDVLSRNRPLAVRFYDAGPGRTRAILADYLVSSGTGRHLSSAEALEAATDLTNLWLGDLPLRLALGLQQPLSCKAVLQRVRRCTRLIIRGYSIR